MELSYFLAQLMGLSLAIFAVAGLVRPQLISAALRDFDHESFSTLAVGFMGVMAGLAVILSHNVWEGSWRVLITLFGWSAFLKGCTYLAAPQVLMQIGRGLMRDKSWRTGLLLVALVLGAYLAYKGFGY